MNKFEVTQCDGCPFISAESDILEVGQYCSLYNINRPGNQGTLHVGEGRYIPIVCDLHNGPVTVQLHRSLIKKGCKKCGAPTFGLICAKCKGERQ